MLSVRYGSKSRQMCTAILVIISVFLLPVCGCRDSRDLSPRHLGTESRFAYYLKRPVSKSMAGSFPICVEFWMEGKPRDVKEASQTIDGFMSFFGQGKPVTSCAEYRKKATCACREESDLSAGTQEGDQGMFNNISKLYTITYYLGADRKASKRECRGRNKYEKAEFVDFR